MSKAREGSVRSAILPLVLLGAFAKAGAAQNCVVGPPFGLGSVVVLPGPCPSGPGPLPNTTCLLLQVNCDGLAPVTAQVRVTAPAAGAPPRGTVVFGTGGSGTGFYGGNAGVQTLFQALVALGFRVVDRAWEAPNGWMGGGAGLRNKSCRYATLLTWIHEEVHTGGAFCATGNSGGSAEIGYALTTWGRGDILDLAVPTSGPPLARLDYSCPFPSIPEWTALCPSIVPPGVMQCVPSCTFGPSGNPVCFDCAANATLQDLRADSVFHEAAALAYPETRAHFLFGTMDCGQSVPLGLVYANAITSERVIEFVSNTPHAIFSTPQGREAIRRAIAQLPRLVATGTPSPGGTLHMNAFGPPGASALLFLGVLPASYAIPGFYGTVGIADPVFVGAGTIGTNETFVWTFPLDPSLAVWVGFSVRFQALLSPKITNTEVVTLQP